MDIAGHEKLIREHLFTDADRVLIRALCGAEFNKESADKLARGLNIDKAESLYLLLLGIVGYRQGWEYFPEEGTPRFKGLHRYYQVRNAAETASLKKRLENLRSEGIPAMLSGAAAARTYYLSDTPRMIDAYDVTVPSDKYKKAATVFDRDAAVSAVSETGQDLVKEPLFRLHRGSPDKRIFTERDLWKSALKVNVLDSEVYVPSPEHSLLYQLCVPYGGWVTSERHTERVLRMFEALNLLGRDLNTKSFTESAEKAGLSAVAKLYFTMLDEIVPERSRASEFTHCFSADSFCSKYSKELSNLCQNTGSYSESLSFTQRLSLYLEKKRIQKMLEKQRNF